MAAKGEFRDKATPAPPPTHGRRINRLAKSCDRSGPLMKAYYQPVVTFAREHLLDDEHGEVHESLVVAETDNPRLGNGVNIVVEPRGAIGALRVVWVGPPSYAPGKQWAETSYCLHVLQRGAGTTIAVDKTSSMIK